VNNEDNLVNQVRNITNLINWNCNLKTKYSDINLGCKLSVSSAINWFFENEEMGIILEDDCLPSLNFFHFCDSLLLKFKDDSNIFAITGCNFQQIKENKNSYFFTNYTHIWGWATWRRAGRCGHA
jgi:GR25 family glycosyltransferase involved in LPS biosynthesis